SASAGAFGPESELFHFADLLPVTVIAADPAGKELYLNGRAREYLGVEREALDGNLWLERIHPSDRQGAASAWQDAAEKGQAHHLEFRLLRSTSGDYRWNRLESVPLRGPDGAVALVFGTLTDIHDRKRSEEEAERRSERQRKFAHR